MIGTILQVFTQDGILRALVSTNLGSNEVQVISIDGKVRGAIKCLYTVKYQDELIGCIFDFTREGKEWIPVHFVSKVEIVQKLIKADVSEPREVWKHLGGICSVESLEWGDYHLNARELVVVERKTADDLCQSIITHRLTDQLARMLSRIKILLIEGFITVDHEGKVRTGSKDRKYSWDFIFNEVMSYQRAGVLVDITSNTWHTARRLMSYLAYFSKAEHTSLNMRPRELKFGDEYPTALNILLGCPGLDEKLAWAVLANFPSVDIICKTSVKELQVVHGIGMKKARQIYDAFHTTVEEQLREKKLKEKGPL